MDAKRVTLMVLAGIILAACASELDRARRTKPMGDRFSRALSNGYLQLAQNEDTNRNYSNADHLARRAINSAKGMPPTPDTAPRGTVGVEKQAQLNAARMRLMEALSTNAKSTTPETAAEAQVAYDCWVLKSDGGNQNELATCRRRYEIAMGLIASGSTPDSMNGTIEHDLTRRMVSTKPVYSPGDEGYRSYQQQPPAIDTTDFGKPKHKFMIFFDFDSADITLEAQDVVDDILAELLATEYRLIRIEGHTDRAGSSQYNEILSVKRAQAVNKALLSALSGATNNSFEGYGESKPSKSTPDGIREVLNRRAEVFLF